jgi:uncharacterized ferritin-like protein (DUF455 family)
VNARDWARSIVEATTLDGKRAPPPADLVLEDAGAALRIPAPGRPANLGIVPGRVARVPPIAGMPDPAQRVRILHALANHELQAIELFAWALLAFPDAPVAFRRGLIAIVADEQRHLALYESRLAAHGTAFGDHPVTGHFWNKLDALATPLQFVCVMGLTFENANLDFAGDYAVAARACGDVETAVALERVHEDEIAHVHFGWTWMRKLSGDADAWTTYNAQVQPPLGPHRARGARFDRASRERAGIEEAFIDKLAATEAKRPSGEPR